MRKQFEMIARTREVEVKVLETIYDKVPNVAFGRPMEMLLWTFSSMGNQPIFHFLNKWVN